MRYIVVSFIAILFLFSRVDAQSVNRVSTYNNIGWYMYFGDHQISKKVSLHTEYQWRRNHFIKTWQQSLARVGINYHINDQAIFTLGYGFIETFPYGEYSIAGTGFPFPEHRIYEQIQLKNPIGRFEISHRFRLEQRWLGKLIAGDGHEIYGWNYLNRIRYQCRIATPLIGNTIDNKEPYLAAYDEIFIGFGKNVANNVFDQNRLYFALGYKVSSQCKFEVGYLNQIVQHGKSDPFTKKPVFEYNNGLQMSLIYNLDFRKKDISK